MERNKIEKLLLVANILGKESLPEDLSTLFVLHEERPDGIVISQNDLYLGNFTSEEVKTVNSLLNGKHKLLKILNKMITLYGSPNILEVDKSLLKLIDFKYSNLYNLMTSLGYRFIDNTNAPTGYIFGKYYKPGTVVYRTISDSEFEFIIFNEDIDCDIQNECQLISRFNELPKVTLKNISSDTQLKKNVCYKIKR